MAASADEGSHRVQFVKGGRNTEHDGDFYETPDREFMRSFELEEETAARQFFETHGFVVIRNVLNAEECEATRDDIWKYVEEKKWSRGVDVGPAGSLPKRDDPTTWSSKWPGMAAEGILGSRVVWTERALLNRQHPRVAAVWQMLLGTKEVVCNMDRYGLFRPTVGDPRFKKNWATEANVHIDMPPWEYVASGDPTLCKEILKRLTYSHENDFIVENNEVGTLTQNELHIQGLINLADNRQDDGGFWIVPGFRHYLPRFVQDFRHLERSYGPTRFCVLPHALMKSLVPLRVTCREGSVVVWDQRTAHGSAPNASPNVRFAQFLKMFPAATLSGERARCRRKVITEHLHEIGFVPSAFGRAIFDLGDDFEAKPKTDEDAALQ